MSALLQGWLWCYITHQSWYAYKQRTQLNDHLWPRDGPVVWSCRIYKQTASLQRSKTPLPNECPAYDTKQSDGELPVMLEIREMRCTPSLPSLPGPLRLGVVAPIYGSNRTKLCTYTKLKCLKYNSVLNDPERVDTSWNNQLAVRMFQFLLSKIWKKNCSVECSLFFQFLKVRLLNYFPYN